MVFIGKSINQVDNINAMETISPLWLDKSLTQNAKLVTGFSSIIPTNGIKIGTHLYFTKSFLSSSKLINIRLLKINIKKIKNIVKDNNISFLPLIINYIVIFIYLFNQFLQN